MRLFNTSEPEITDEKYEKSNWIYSFNFCRFLDVHNLKKAMVFVTRWKTTSLKQNTHTKQTKVINYAFWYLFWNWFGAEICCKSSSKTEGKVQQPVREVLALHRSVCLAYRSVINCLKWWLFVQTSKTMWKCIEMKHYPERAPVFLQVQFEPICQINTRTILTKILENKKAVEIFPSIRSKTLHDIVLNVLISSPEFSVTITC